MQPWEQMQRVLLLLSGLIAVVISLMLVSPTGGDGSYTCDQPPVWLLVHPASTDTAAYRQVAFDEGYQCNLDARARGVAAGLVAMPGAIVVGLYFSIRRRRLRTALAA